MTSREPNPPRRRPRTASGGRLLFVLAALVAAAPAPRAAPLLQAQSHQVPAAAATERPLPDLKTFVQQVRKRLQSDRLLLSQYTYLEKRTDVRVSKLGKVSKGSVKLFEVYPSLEEGATYRRLIEVDGEPVPPDELKRRDREHQQRMLERAEQLKQEGTSARTRRLKKEAEERAKEQQEIEDLFTIYEIELVGRAPMDGHETIVAELTPRPRARAQTKNGKLLKKLRARAWVSERDHELVRVEAEAIEDITIGLGFIGRLHKGSTLAFRRTKVNGEIWLPAEARFNVSGRTLVFRKFELDIVNEYSDHRRFAVDTSTSFALPRPPG